MILANLEISCEQSVSQEIKTFDGSKNITSLRGFDAEARFCPNDQQFVFIAGKQAGKYDTESRQFTYKVGCHQNVTCFSFSPIGDFVVCGSDDGSWSMHDL